ncbi:diguanylate cyclase [Microcoleus sp. bin38.metabat.b11b12b14.051]|uniref:diguanylate cyclase domain-containing protein n=1 Tax=Microcoleus sp. bin38.metabat.b11b12b14.051 TaxID=2742709 RepID=UPI0025D2681A|nr:diguanylate cyclase [Microcoleus sp. bin38.metabat.b11b12b14.051]
MLTRNQSLKILLVEDDLADATLIEDLLGSFSDSLFRLQTVKCLEIGLACLEAENFDAVLLDLSVADSLGGSEALAILKARSPTVPVVVLTDINDENTALSVLRSGAQDCLVKGRFHRTLLVRAIHYAIERQRIEEQLRQQALRERLLGQMIEHIRSSIDATSILQNTVAEVRQFLKTDRVLVYRCQDWASPLDGEQQKGAIVAGDGLPDGYIENQNINAALAVSCFFLVESQSVQAIADISAAPLADSCKELLVDCEIAAVLSVPIWQSGDWETANQRLEETVWESEKIEDTAENYILLPAVGKPQVQSSSAPDAAGKNGNILWGMLTAYNCSGVREWQEWEIDFLQHLANQVAIAIEQSQLYRQLAIANQKLQQLATTDGLTGIANRRQFDRVLMLEWRRLAREEMPLSLIMFDIDFFKLYNDFYGHLGGDDCLRQVAGAIASCAKRAGDLPARYGGEEFAVVLPNTSAAGANVVARKICDTIADLKLPHARSSIGPYVTLSCGIATVIPAAEASPDTLISSADSALYQAKSAGKNRICHASSQSESCPLTALGL